MTDVLQLPEIPAVDAAARAAASAHLDSLTKPPGSLGRLEELAVWLAGVQARPRPRLESSQVFVVAADHGVAQRAVSAYPQAVTAQMVENFLAGGAAVSVLARLAGAEVTVVDAGIATDLGPRAGLLSRRLGAGTADFTQAPAMSDVQARRCIETGLELADTGADAVVCGEMGIGNTTAASALTAALLGRPAREVTGRGTGIDDATWQRKLEAIEATLALHTPEPGRPLAVLAALGGFEIGVLAGLIVGAASRRRAVVLDGFISTAAALVAVALAPACHDYLVASHLSAEPGHRLSLGQLGLRPLLDLELRLGEGSGGVLALPLLTAACRILDEMATFESAGVSRSEEGLRLEQ